MREAPGLRFQRQIFAWVGSEVLVDGSAAQVEGSSTMALPPSGSSCRGHQGSRPSERPLVTVPGAAPRGGSGAHMIVDDDV